MDPIELELVPEERITTAVFLGKDRHRRITGADGNGSYTAMADCRNMTSDEYPCACVRRQRLIISNKRDKSKQPADCLPGKLYDAVNAGQHIAWLINSGEILCGEKNWSDSISGDPGRIIPFGRGLFRTGTPKYIPSVDDDEDFPAAIAVTAKVSVFAAVTEADGYIAVTATEAPASPKEGDYYYNTAEETKGIYQYVNGQWIAVPSYYMALTMPAVTQGQENELENLRDGQWINISEGYAENPYIGWAKVAAVTNKYLFIRTVADVRTDLVTLNIRRRAPILDYAVAHDNRIWGCRYGINDEGAFVNEIYASRLGDPTCWFNLDSTEESCVVISVGEPGPWTGAAVLNDNIVFFKENCMVTVYGSSPSSYSTQLTYCAGIADGSDRSAVMINGALYYHSPKGIMRLYSGSLPVQISDDLSLKNAWIDAIGGTDGRKYYVQLTSKTSSLLYVYDTTANIWQIENPEANTFCMVPFANELLAISSYTDEDAVVRVRAAFLSVPDDNYPLPFQALYLCEKTNDTTSYVDGYIRPGKGGDIDVMILTPEETVPWWFETGDFGHDYTDYKRVKSVVVRARLDTDELQKDAEFNIDIQYDEDGRWQPLVRSDTIRQGRSGTVRVEYSLRRCDLFRLRFSGKGNVVIYSITLTYEGAGDRGYGTN